MFPPRRSRFPAGSRLELPDEKEPHQIMPACFDAGMALCSGYANPDMRRTARRPRAVRGEATVPRSGGFAERRLGAWPRSPLRSRRLLGPASEVVVAVELIVAGAFG